jgi:hypothetical protein
MGNVIQVLLFANSLDAAFAAAEGVAGGRVPALVDMTPVIVSPWLRLPAAASVMR